MRVVVSCERSRPTFPLHDPEQLVVGDVYQNSRALRQGSAKRRPSPSAARFGTGSRISLGYFS